MFKNAFQWLPPSPYTKARTSPTPLTDLLSLRCHHTRSAGSPRPGPTPSPGSGGGVRLRTHTLRACGPRRAWLASQGGLQPPAARVRLSLGGQTPGAARGLRSPQDQSRAISILSSVTVLSWLVSPELPALLGQLLK